MSDSQEKEQEKLNNDEAPEEKEKKEEELQNPEKQEEKKEEKEQEEDKKDENEKAEKAPIPEKDKNELNAEEEGKKEILDAIKDLKPEEVSANVKSKLILLSNVHSEYLKIKEDQYGVEYDTLRDIYDKNWRQYLQV